jgi:hypothetical protein
MSVIFTKIRFALDSADWHGSSSETLWATPMPGSDRADLFVLENSPFYAKGVSYLDVVRAIEQEGGYEYADTVAPSGHSTYRLLIDRPSAAFDGWWKKLEELGCTYESGDIAGKKLFSVDVPAETDVYAVYKILEDGEKQRVWIFEKGHFGHPLKGKPPANIPGRA